MENSTPLSFPWTIPLNLRTFNQPSVSQPCLPVFELTTYALLVTFVSFFLMAIAAPKSLKAIGVELENIRVCVKIRQISFCLHSNAAEKFYYI
jgi:hypothetical protein